jgi:hypothetical protein
MSISCSRIHVKVVRIDPAFTSYVDDFVSDGAIVGYNVVIDDLIIEFTNNLTQETLGQCQFGDEYNTPVITIDSQDWPNETDEYRKIVLYHELGHCQLNRQHVTTGTILQSNCSATSIMYPYIQDTTNMYSENWNWYVKELFYPNTWDPISQLPGSYCMFNSYWGGI